MKLHRRPPLFCVSVLEKVASKSAGRTRLRAPNAGSSCLNLLQLNTSVTYSLLTEKKKVFREILWDMEINLVWQDEDFLDKLPLPWCSSAKKWNCYVTLMTLKKLVAWVKHSPFSCLQIRPWEASLRENRSIQPCLENSLWNCLFFSWWTSPCE